MDHCLREMVAGRALDYHGPPQPPASWLQTSTSSGPMGMEEGQEKKEGIVTRPIIPKVIHWIWVTPDETHLHNLIPMEKWRMMARFAEVMGPEGYQFKLWTNEHLPLFPREVVEACRRTRKGAQMADIMRAHIIWSQGGIYMDIGYDLLSSPTALFDWLQEKHGVGLIVCNEVDTVRWTDSVFYISNGCFAAAPRHPALAIYLEEVLKYDPSLPVGRQTGPYCFGEAVKRFVLGGPHQPPQNSPSCGLPRSLEHDPSLLGTKVCRLGRTLFYPVHYSQNQQLFPSSQFTGVSLMRKWFVGSWLKPVPCAQTAEIQFQNLRMQLITLAEDPEFRQEAQQIAGESLLLPWSSWSLSQEIIPSFSSSDPASASSEKLQTVVCPARIMEVLPEPAFMHFLRQLHRANFAELFLLSSLPIFAEQCPKPSFWHLLQPLMADEKPKGYMVNLREAVPPLTEPDLSGFHQQLFSS